MCETCCINGCHTKNMLNIKMTAFAAKISQGVLPVDKIMTLLTLFENTFFLNNTAAF